MFIFTKVLPVWAELFHMDRRTDVTKRVDAFRSFVNAYKTRVTCRIAGYFSQKQIVRRNVLPRKWTIFSFRKPPLNFKVSSVTEKRVKRPEWRPNLYIYWLDIHYESLEYLQKTVLIHGNVIIWIASVRKGVLILFGFETEDIVGKWEILQGRLYPDVIMILTWIARRVFFNAVWVYTLLGPKFMSFFNFLE
jgi:hypothetical protein